MKKNVKIAVSELKVGVYVSLPISWKDHPFLFSKFKVTSQTQIELIKSLGVKDVFYDPERSDIQPVTTDNSSDPEPFDEASLDTIKQDMLDYKSERIDKQQKLKRNIKKTEKQFERSVSMMHSMVGKIASRPLNAVSEAKDLISNLTNLLLDEDNLALHLMENANPKDIIHHHSLNVSMVCMLMAKELGWSREEIELLGIGCLFHDIGKLKIPSNILNKVVPLSTPEENLVKQHPLMSINFLKLADTFPEEAKPMITHHHEYLDGSGSPQGLKADQLDKFAQLIAVVNTYDNLCNGSHLVKAKTPSVALGLLYKNYKNKLNAEYVQKLIKILGIYPPGSIVELSNGHFGLVMSVNLNNILFPSIVAYDPIVPIAQSPIIELEKEGMSIVRSLPAAALPEKIHKYLNPRETISYAFGQG
ncbi:HD-GYP domain-containing protein [Shewanella sp. HL-SH4]|uniref:HD-GYP domain-containing protein n=1 Tax=Shewanella sp. HL-SH4 TaxID=3436240 RepID=UPI003EB97484